MHSGEDLPAHGRHWRVGRDQHVRHVSHHLHAEGRALGGQLPPLEHLLVGGGALKGQAGPHGRGAAALSVGGINGPCAVLVHGLRLSLKPCIRGLVLPALHPLSGEDGVGLEVVAIGGAAVEWKRVVGCTPVSGSWPAFKGMRHVVVLVGGGAIKGGGVRLVGCTHVRGALRHGVCRVVVAIAGSAIKGNVSTLKVVGTPARAGAL
mmetsp:Transcript_32310/g.71484  ORF Transcript_32310/g.71484 Transcript_32310/m.71484 type:complete len:206 (+) Transcript_32310:790-1407(+)